MQVARKWTARERGTVDRLAQHLAIYPRETVLRYYCALMTRRFVILAGPAGRDKVSLARGVAEVLAGPSDSRWCLLRAHAWWTTRTGNAARFADLHARFSTLKVLAFIEEAGAAEAAQLSFFLCLEQMSPAEVLCYFDDLPRGILWQPDGSVSRVRLPGNLYVTGTIDLGQREQVFLPRQRPAVAIVEIGPAVADPANRAAH